MNQEQLDLMMALLYSFHPEVLDMEPGEEREKMTNDFYDEVVQAGLDHLLSIKMFMDAHTKEEANE